MQGNRILAALAELVIGWRLAEGARVAHAALASATRPDDKAFYQGKLAAARFYAKQVMPGLALARKLVEASDSDVVELSDASW